ncbi:MAG TPA: hypothetical protein VMB48_01975 [Steroidobacteraceae bacterium]|nr:hypothetical protein [Steroidobacteraceae bacterium]
MPRPLLRELLWLLAAAAAGVLVVPPLIYMVGRRVFGAYAGGGMRDLMGHFFAGLGQGILAFWVAAAGPYVMITLLRLLAWLLWRRTPQQA